MRDDHFPLRNRAGVPSSRRNSTAEVQYLLRAEEQLLHLISARIPLAGILHKICDSLNSEIGNIVSLASLRDDDPIGLSNIVKSAHVFGLHKFCSAPIAGANEEMLGSMEIYCCMRRRPFLSEIGLIERATCLAAVAIQRDKETGDAVSPAPVCAEVVFAERGELILQDDAEK